MTQTEEILECLKSGYKITPLEALNKFGCMRLGARIWDLKREGHPIKKKTLLLSNGKTVAQYYYEVNNA
jgi:hypothetical protein